MTSMTVQDDVLRLHFDSFDLEDYALFLKAKKLPEMHTQFDPESESYTIEAPARYAALFGALPPAKSASTLPLAWFLFEDQAAIVQMALDAKRFACWSDCGLGKTLIQLEFARHVVQRTGGRVLIVTLNEIVNQTIDEAKKWYADVQKFMGRMVVLRLYSREEMRQWMAQGQPGIAITNYEKWNPKSQEDQIVNEARQLAGIVLDESSRLKGGGGKQKWALIKSCRGIEYKLSCTATPAPNDIMEFASQASFLEKMRSEGEIIWTYFVRDATSHRWTVKPHAREAFFRWMSSWSIYVRSPKRYGWRLQQKEIPAPLVQVHQIEITSEQEALRRQLLAHPDGQKDFFGDDSSPSNAITRLKLSQIAKGFRYRRGQNGKYDEVPSRKPCFVIDLIHKERASGKKILVWTCFDAESKILAQRLSSAGECAVLTGKTKEQDRLDILERFRNGHVPVLISRAAVLGYGINLQCCECMIFSGWSDSYESYYQAIRRAYRYGQKKRLHVHIPVIEELEGDMLDNIFRKQAEHEAAIAEMESNFIMAREQRA